MDNEQFETITALLRHISEQTDKQSRLLDNIAHPSLFSRILTTVGGVATVLSILGIIEIIRTWITGG
ncbi:MAG: hypothetical protein Pg6C_02690 [Treponemataceae bacterium]|nr:MAG: hypothetical protein Pg6C_02690 [Treponemataceae bacterium]